jgi:hypothetical protein
MVGSSMGARLVLEMARRGRTRAAVALDPGGFWQGWERGFIDVSLTASVALLRVLRGALPALGHNAIARTALLPQLSAHPWALDGDTVETELQSFADTPTFDALIKDLAYGPLQPGPAAPGSGPGHDRLGPPRPALPARPGGSARRPPFRARGSTGSNIAATFPQWDEPDATIALILEAVG